MRRRCRSADATGVEGTAALTIGDAVRYRGRVYYLHRFTSASVASLRVFLLPLGGGELVVAPLADIRPVRVGVAVAA